MKNKPLINNIPLLFGIIFLFASFSNFIEPNYGFSDVSGGESFGYNFVILVIYLCGPYLIYKSIKKKREDERESIGKDQDNNDSIQLDQLIESEEKEQSKIKQSDNKKTISYLNSKVWYRFIKVIYILLFIFVLLAYNLFVLYDIGLKQLDQNKTQIICNKTDKTFTAKQANIELKEHHFKNGFNYKEFFETYYGFNSDIAVILEDCYGKDIFGTIADDIYDYQKLLEIAKTYEFSNNNDTEKLKPMTSDYNDYKTSTRLQPETDKILYLDYNILLFDIKPVFTYNSFIQYFVIGNIIILLLFESIKRIFYYIALGTIKPKK